MGNLGNVKACEMGMHKTLPKRRPRHGIPVSPEPLHTIFFCSALERQGVEH